MKSSPPSSTPIRPRHALERGDRTVTVWQVASASGAKYEGQNVMFWSKGS